MENQCFLLCFYRQAIKNTAHLMENSNGSLWTPATANNFSLIVYLIDKELQAVHSSELYGKSYSISLLAIRLAYCPLLVSLLFLTLLLFFSLVYTKEFIYVSILTCEEQKVYLHNIILIRKITKQIASHSFYYES